MLAAGIRCRICQRHILHTFIDGFVPVSRELRLTQPKSHALQNIRKSPVQHLRSYQTTQFKRTRTDGQEGTSTVESSAVDQDVAELKEEQDSPTQTSSAPDNNNPSQEVRPSIPWYLQDRPTFADASPVSERQRIPDLPPDPPPMLQSLLNHLSIEIGLDHLAIQDLRKLDPPPALGNNLLMIFGTARSIKHLNVSADRLCRWLRSEHKLSPFADGLLGRNELKLKLRRKSKRAKILNAAGAAGSHQADDGITTNWICVDVGRVDSGIEIDEAELAKPEGFVGFGTESNAVKIVVQIMTEDKRGEIDLEGLWQGALDRAARRDARRERVYDFSEENAEDVDPEDVDEMGHTLGMHNDRMSATSQSVNELPFQGKTFPREQIRRFHSSVTRSTDVSQNRSHDLDAQAIPTLSSVNQFTPINMLRRKPVPLADATAEDVQKALENFLSLDDESAREALGKGETDRGSTSFLQSFYSSWPLFPGQSHYEAAITLHCHALHLCHPGYTKSALVTDLLTDMEAAGVEVSEDKFLEVLDAILNTPHSPSSVIGINDAYHALRRDLGRAFAIMERMEAYGYDLRTDKIFKMLHTAVTYPTFSFNGPPPKQGEQYELDTLGGQKMLIEQHHVREVMERLYVPSDEVIMDMIDDYTQHGNWTGVRRLWDLLPRRMRHRGPKLYAQLFHLTAESGNESRCQETLREYTLEMEREDPPVPLEGEVAMAVTKCLLVANVDEEPFWLDLHAKCRKALPETFREPVEQTVEVQNF